MQIHVQRGSEELGVYSPEETTQFLSEGKLLETDVAWHEGLNDWAPLGGLIRQFGESKPSSGSSDAIPKATPEEPDVFGQGRYKWLKVLGKGGQGEVWLAHDQQLDREVAIKKVSAKFAPAPWLTSP